MRIKIYGPDVERTVRFEKRFGGGNFLPKEVYGRAETMKVEIELEGKETFDDAEQFITLNYPDWEVEDEDASDAAWEEDVPGGKVEFYLSKDLERE